MKCKVRLEPIGEEYYFECGTSLRDVLIAHNFDFPCGGNGICGKCKVRVIAGNINVDEKHSRLLRAMNLSSDWRLACYSYVTEDVTLYFDQRYLSIISDSAFIAATTEKGFGIAVDLGSTTIVSQLVNLENGNIISTVSSINPQSAYGADIISRISYALSSQEHALFLSRIVKDTIKSQILNLLSAKCYDIRKIFIVGNSVMQHLFCSFDVAPLSVFPFQSNNNGMQVFKPSDLGLANMVNCDIYFLPNLGHFVGSDILAGIEAIQMHKQKRFQVLVDLGTNGEIVVGNSDIIIYTSTAAGPAFEGVNISQGMKASNGAIYQVNEIDSSIQVIGNSQPIGICGSGLIDAIHYFLKIGLIDNFGTILENCHFLPICQDIGLNDRDIREFQLAKAAVRTGMDILLEKGGISYDDVEHVYVAGGLGNYLNIDKAISLGLFDSRCIGKIVKSGNTALRGAKMFLFEDFEKDISNIVHKAEYCALELFPNFQDIYCNNLLFSDR